MRLGRMLMIVALVLIIGTGVIFAIFYFTGGGFGAGEPEVTAVPMSTVILIGQPVVRGEPLTAEKLLEAQFPQDKILPTMFTSPEQVIGKVARFDMDQTTIITANMVVDNPSSLAGGGGSDHALLIPAGKVAFPIPITRFSSVGYGLSEGDRVNVIATLMFVDLDEQFQTLLPNLTSSILAPGQTMILNNETYGSEDRTSSIQFINSETGEETEGFENLVAQIISSGTLGRQGRAELDAVLNQPFYVVQSETSQRPRIVSQTVLYNSVVLNVGTFGAEEAADAAQAAADAAILAQAEAAANGGEPAPIVVEEPKKPDIITLIVSPQEAVTLNYLIYSGAELTLALRSGADESIVTTEAVTLQFLMNSYNIPLPSRESFGLSPRVDELVQPVLPNDIPTPTPTPVN